MTTITLTTAQIASMPTSAIAALSTSIIANLSSAQVSAFSTAQVSALTTAQPRSNGLLPSSPTESVSRNYNSHSITVRFQN
jgi:hypothetical protein